MFCYLVCCIVNSLLPVVGFLGLPMMHYFHLNCDIVSNVMHIDASSQGIKI